MSELKDAIRLVCEEKGIKEEAVLETIEAALAAAYRKDFGNKMQNLKVNYDLETSQMEVFDIKLVVADMDLEELAKEQEQALAEGREPEKRFNPKTETMLAEAKKIKPKIKVGEELIVALEVPAGFGRVAAQTAKQVIIQRLREAERATIFEEYKEKEGQIVNGVVQRKEGRNVLVDLGGALAVMPPEEQVPTETYYLNQRYKFLIGAVSTTVKGPEIIVSRLSTDFVKELFRLEVPEIASGTVEIKAIAREGGVRTKLAVTSDQDNIDPVGSCVGQRGSRVQTVIAELNGEKIDIINYQTDPEKFIEAALSPAKVMSINLDVANQTAQVKVLEDQLSLAIGRNGQNVRLASKLTGWRIEIEGGEEFLKDQTEVAPEVAGEVTPEVVETEAETTKE
ncbi:MAG: transcription termination factor NusA [Candidatus Komeilibacteria bacterium]|nr:transcription termination factor NusA [Candidatus Komeilibacteria bacterium]